MSSGLSHSGIERQLPVETAEPTEATPSGVGEGALSSAAALPESVSGRNWLTVAAACFAQATIDGLCFAPSLCVRELGDTYGATEGTVSAMNAVCNGLMMCAAPLVCALVHRFGFRFVGVSGGVVTSLLIASNVFAPTFLYVFVTFGVFAGTTWSSVMMTSLLICNFHFVGKRELANGIVTCGSGLGLLVFPPLLSSLLTAYGLPGLLLGVAIPCLATAFTSLAYFPPTTSPDPADDGLPVNVNDSVAESYPMKTASAASAASNRLTVPERRGMSASIVSLHRMRPVDSRSRALDFSVIDRKIYGDSGIHYPFLSRLHLPEISSSSGHLKSPPEKVAASYDQLPSFIGPKTVSTSALDRWHENRNAETRQQFLTPGDAKQNGIFVEPAAVTAAVTAAVAGSDGRSECARDGEAEVAVEAGVRLRCSDLCNLEFTLVTVHCVFWSIYIAPLMSLPSYALHRGVSSGRSASLLSFLGVSCLLGRLAAGLILDRKLMRPFPLDCVALCVAGVTSILFFTVASFHMLATLAAVYGFTNGVFVSLRQILLIDLIGLENLTKAFSLVSFLQGLSTAFFPSITGLLFDLTGSYLAHFLTASLVLLASATISLVLHLFHGRPPDLLAPAPRQIS